MCSHDSIVYMQEQLLALQYTAALPEERPEERNGEIMLGRSAELGGDDALQFSPPLSSEM